MSSRESQPNWWQVYLVLPLLIALFAVDNRLVISTRGHQVVQIGIILFVYGLVRLWLKANSQALTGADRERGHGTFRVVRFVSDGFPETDTDGRPLFRLPDSEIKGVLNDTFEMDIIDAEFLPMEEAPQELNKE